jgi:hypothetical protein
MSARIAPATGVVAVLMLLIAAACSNDETQPAPTATARPPTSTPLATPTPAPTATPQAIDGVEVLPLRFGEEMELPEDVALIIETGCWQCDGPPTGLYRLYRDASGQLRTDELFPAETAGFQTDQSAIHSYALNTDASEIVVSVCTRGECAWLDSAQPDAQATLYRSLDGGVTWSEFGILDGQTWVVAITKGGVLLAHYDRQQQAPPKFQLFPSGEPVQPPAGANWWPFTLPGGELVWRTQDGCLLRSDGSEALPLGEGAHVDEIVADATGRRFAATWWPESPSLPHLIGLFSRDGRPISAFSLSDSARVGGWLSDTLVAGNAAVPQGLLPTPEPDSYAMNFVPVIFDLETGEAHPLAGPFHEPPFFGRNYVRAVLRGPFARVVETGSCLNVRAEPGMNTAVLACAADSVLLSDTGETRQVDGATWRRVVTPGGVEGWAYEKYLER